MPSGRHFDREHGLKWVENVLEFLIVIALLAGAALFSLKLSLFERRRTAVIVACLTALQPLALVPWFVTVPWATVRNWFSSPSVVEGLAAILVAEAMLSMGLAVIVLRKHYGGRNVAARWGAALYPPVAFLAPLNLAQIALLNRVANLSFATTAGLAALATALLLLMASVPARFFFRWPTRMEMLVAGLGIQLFVSAALPVLLGHATAPASDHLVSVSSSIVFLLVCAAGVSGGYVLNRTRKNTK